MKSKLYSPYQIENMTAKQINKAYSELRSVANKRLQRLEKAGLGTRGSYRFPTLKEIQNSNRMNAGSQLADVSRFLRSDRTTVTGEKRFLQEFKQSMEERGYKDLVDTTEKIYNTLEFMESVREQYGNKIFDSGDTLDVLQEAQRLNIPLEKVQKNIDFFLQNADRLSSVKPSRGGAEFSQRRINNLVKKWS